MKIKQTRRWKKRTVQEQNEISNRLSGRILWAVLLLGGIGTLTAIGISGSNTTPQSASHTMSDSFFQKADEKMTAAFPARNLFLHTLTNGIAATGGNRIGNVYFTEERLLECPRQLDTAALSDTAAAINRFYTAYQVPTAVIAVPPAGEFYADDLLDGISYPSQMTSINSFYQKINSPVRKIDVYHVLFTSTSDYIYYRTDTKWSSYGAYCVYRNAIQRMGFAPISYDQYTVTHVAAFRGNLYDACLYSKVTPDILDVYQNESGSQITNMTAYPADEKPQERQLCDTTNDAASDPDAFYLGTPCEKIVIQTNLDNQKKLLLLKDSYADCMVPFLAQHYSEICILDVTKMEHPLSELADVSDYTQVLILCDADTFAEQETAAVFTEEKKK